MAAVSSRPPGVSFAVATAVPVTRRPPAWCWAIMPNASVRPLNGPGPPPRPRTAPRRSRRRAPPASNRPATDPRSVPGAATSKDADRTPERSVASSAVQRDHRTGASRTGQRRARVVPLTPVEGTAAPVIDGNQKVPRVRKSRRGNTRRRRHGPRGCGARRSRRHGARIRPDSAAPDCDQPSAPDHSLITPRITAAPAKEPGFADPTARPHTNLGTRNGVREKPGATTANLAICRPGRCSSVTPAGPWSLPFELSLQEGVSACGVSDAPIR